ncbi:hypothetical protein H0H93_015529 [Arthromyces matolae]|nr:hypothetical protein H0H93_015529 [Arthromyces matolae]
MTSELPPSITVFSGDTPPPGPRRYDTHRRMFIGPMPQKVISHTEKQQSKQGSRRSNSQDDQDRDEISEIIKRNAFNFFIREGGRPENWGEDEERNVVEEMFRRWASSEWSQLWRSRKEQKTTSLTSRWVGSSFEIGQFLGVNILKGTESAQDVPSGSKGSRLIISSLSAQKQAPTTISVDRTTFATAPSGSHSENEVSEPGDSINTGEYIHASSSTSLLPSVRPQGGGSKAHTQVSLSRPMLFDIPSSLVQGDGAIKGKGKARAVHYTDAVEEEPAPPAEVLERTGTQALLDTSAGAALNPASVEMASTSEAGSDLLGDVIMRDRMLVRTYYSKSDNVGVRNRFDEQVHRTTRDLLDADSAEYLVIWRKDRLELYTDYVWESVLLFLADFDVQAFQDIPCKEWFTGHKHIAFVIPLIPTKTHLSLYSFVDSTFCITCPPAEPSHDGSKRRFFLLRTREGTNIFIFKHKSRSRAFDWIWRLWLGVITNNRERKQLGHKLPLSIDVRNPRVNTKVQIDIPQGESENPYQVFTPENVIALCMKAYSAVPDWKSLIERELSRGKKLQLAWRQDTDLDWIWLDDDIYGQERPWSVLFGLALQQSIRPPTLEIRIAEHLPNHIHLKNATRLHEPPAIEGYVERIRPNSQTRQGLYLSTHDGNLFVMTPSHAYPPSPPGLAKDITDIEAYGESLRKSEIHRGAMQIMHAIGVNDLRDILVIRRALHPVLQESHKETPGNQKFDIWASIREQPEERTSADNDDEGGEEGLERVDDKVHRRMRRSFELLLTTGRVVRFETHSCRDAAEWIERLRALVLYWKQRHRLDANEEMDLAHSRRPRLTPRTRVRHDENVPPESPPDMGAPMPALGTLYSWCILDGCKPNVKGGKLFVRKGLWGQYKYVQLFLAAGHLVHFRIKPNSSLHQATHKKTSLLDAYVCSGYLAAVALPRGQYNANTSPDPRRYNDGLETNDPEEEMMFMIWYHPQGPHSEHSAHETTKSSKKQKALPAISEERKVLVFRTRSRLERDAWCYALNCEIERLVRARRDREIKLRDAGNIKP